MSKSPPNTQIIKKPNSLAHSDTARTRQKLGARQESLSRRNPVVLNEETYNAAVEAIIERDFFPDYPVLQQQLCWLEALESNDLFRIAEARASISSAIRRSKQVMTAEALKKTKEEHHIKSAAMPTRPARGSSLLRKVHNAEWNDAESVSSWTADLPGEKRYRLAHEIRPRAHKIMQAENPSLPASSSSPASPPSLTSETRARTSSSESLLLHSSGIVYEGVECPDNLAAGPSGDSESHGVLDSLGLDAFQQQFQHEDTVSFRQVVKQDEKEREKHFGWAKTGRGLHHQDVQLRIEDNKKKQEVLALGYTPSPAMLLKDSADGEKIHTGALVETKNAWLEAGEQRTADIAGSILATNGGGGSDGTRNMETSSMAMVPANKTLYPDSIVAIAGRKRIKLNGGIVSEPVIRRSATRVNTDILRRNIQAREVLLQNNDPSVAEETRGAFYGYGKQLLDSDEIPEGGDISGTTGYDLVETPMLFHESFESHLFQPKTEREKMQLDAFNAQLESLKDRILNHGIESVSDDELKEFLNRQIDLFGYANTSVLQRLHSRTSTSAPGRDAELIPSTKKHRFSIQERSNVHDLLLQKIKDERSKPMFRTTISSLASNFSSISDFTANISSSASVKSLRSSRTHSASNMDPTSREARSIADNRTVVSSVSAATARSNVSIAFSQLSAAGKSLAERIAAQKRKQSKGSDSGFGKTF